MGGALLVGAEVLHLLATPPAPATETGDKPAHDQGEAQHADGRAPSDLHAAAGHGDGHPVDGGDAGDGGGGGDGGDA